MQTFHTRYFAFLLVMILSFSSSPMMSRVQAGSGTLPAGIRTVSSEIPSLREFRTSVLNGAANSVAGVYVPDVMAFTVTQQPASNPAYVSENPDVLTQFSLATSYKTIGLLGHNYLAGKSFFELKPLQKVIVIYGDGRQKTYIISKIDTFQALQPNSPFSNFKEAGNPDVTLSVADVFYRIYGPGNRLVFQTCVEADGIASWGRLFVTAYPLNEELLSLTRKTERVTVQ